jgi:peptidoglycan/LPS O-acetylase OafA/YrhL
MREPKTIRPLTGLRGVLALWVVLLHITLALELNGFSVADRLSPHAARLMLSGIIAVDGFFILSGFILAYTHARDFAHSGAGLWRRCLKFWALRLARIYPTHVAVLAVYAALPLVGIALPLASCGNPFNRPIPCDRFSLAHLSDQLLLIASWGVDPVIGWNLPAWSVSSEWFVYLCFPVLVLPAMRLGARGAALAAVTSLALMSVLAALFLPRFLGLADDYGLVRAVPEFFCGCCLYRIWTAQGISSLRWPAIGAAAALIMLAALAFGILPAVSVFCLAVLILALAGARQGWLGWMLSSSPLQWLGRVSYSLYLTHLLTIELVGYADGLQAKINPFKTPWIGVRAYLALLILSLVVALLFNLTIEEPARRYLRGLLARRDRGVD